MIIRKKLCLECFCKIHDLAHGYNFLCEKSSIRIACVLSKTPQEKLTQASADVVFIQIIIIKKSLTREIEHKQYLLFNRDTTGMLNARMEFPLHNKKVSYTKFNSHFANSHL